MRDLPVRVDRHTLSARREIPQHGCSAFELLTARAFAYDVRLRDMWFDAKASYDILEEFEVDPYYVLQAISTSVVGSAKRSAVLNLSIPQITENWEGVVAGVASGLRMLQDECGVLVERWLPYKTMIVTLGAAWSLVAEARGPAVGERRTKLKRWFWCSAFSGSYENSSNSTAEADVLALGAWLHGGEEPPVVRNFSFDPARWLDVTPRQRALYSATMALSLSLRTLDFHERSPQ